MLFPGRSFSVAGLASRSVKAGVALASSSYMCSRIFVLHRAAWFIISRS
jgi:hypothetical protein